MIWNRKYIKHIYNNVHSENIVLDKEGHAVLTDFGLSKTEVSSSAQTYTFCGTPECMYITYFY